MFTLQDSPFPDDNVSTATFDPSSRMQSSKVEGHLLGSPGHELRTRVRPVRGCLSGDIGQLVMQFGSEFYVGSCTILSPMNYDRECLLLTCAHNFIQASEVAPELSKTVDSAFFYRGRDGPGTYMSKHKVKRFLIHPRYLKNPSINSGWDLAVATFDHTGLAGFDQYTTYGLYDGGFGSTAHCDYTIMCDYAMIDAGIQRPQAGARLQVIGYPGEKDSQEYKMSGTIYNTPKGVDNADADFGQGELILYKDIDTTGGQSGSPVALEKSAEDMGGLYEMDGPFLIIVGVHVGCASAAGVNVATRITDGIMEWIYSSSTRSFLFDLK